MPRASPCNRSTAAGAVLAALAALLLFWQMGANAAGQAPAPPSAQQSEPADTDSAAAAADPQQVTIEGQRKSVETRARTFISQLTALSGDNSLQRWRQPICPLVAGLQRKHGEIVLGRLSQIAVAVGAPLGPQQCRANSSSC